MRVLGCRRDLVQMSEAQLRDQVVLEVAVALVTQQHNALLYRFHTHLLQLQDAFHSATRSVRDEFDVCSSVFVAMPQADGAADAALIEQRMSQAIDHYKAVAEQEIRHFNEDTFLIQQQFKDDAFRASADWRAAERKRQDDFAAAMVLARREVAATCYMMKAEQAQSQTEVSALAHLRSALDQALVELNKLRAESELARTKLEVELLDTSRRHESERAEWHAALRAERDAATRQLKELVAETDAARRQHLAELSDAASNAAGTVDAARAELARISSLHSEAQREADEARREAAELQKRHANERLDMQKTIAGLEYENEKLRLLLDAERSETSHSSLELRRNLEARKNAEVEEFKRRLIGSLANPTNSASPRSITAGGDSSSPPMSTRRELGGTVGGLSPNDRGASSLSARGPSQSLLPPHSTLSFSPRSMSHLGTQTASAGLANSPSALRGGSVDTMNSMRSPSDTFVRLQQLSASWKDRLATL